MSEETYKDRRLVEVHHFRSCTRLKNTSFRMSSMLTFILLAVTASLAWSKNLDIPEPEPFRQNQLELQPDDATLENALVRYLLTKEWLSRLRPMELEKKRGYWKQCAFNAVSCFGK